MPLSETSRNRSQTILRRALFANAAFSTFSAAECLLAPEAVSRFVGLPVAEVRGIGIDLALFVGLLLFAATRKDLGTRAMRWVTGSIIVMDALWVVGSAILLMVPNPLTTAGVWTVGLVALAVAELAGFQAYGWWGLRSTPVPAAATA